MTIAAFLAGAADVALSLLLGRALDDVAAAVVGAATAAVAARALVGAAAEVRRHHACPNRICFFFNETRRGVGREEERENET